MHSFFYLALGDLLSRTIKAKHIRTVIATGEAAFNLFVFTAAARSFSKVVKAVNQYNTQSVSVK